MSVSLREIHPLELDMLRDIELEPANANRWRHFGRTPSPAEHKLLLYTGVLEQRVIIVDDEPAGLVVAYNHDPRSQVAWFAAVTSERYHETGVGVIACAQFVDYLWRSWPLRKLYASVPATNLAQFASLTRRCSLEGNFSGSMTIDRQPVDVHILGMSREQWQASNLPAVAARSTRHLTGVPS